MKKFICLLTLILLLFTGCSSRPERTKDIVVLFTGDVHCAVEENIGYASLKAYKDKLIEEGKEVLLIDTGDAIQGGMIGSYSKGEGIIEIMNELGYSAMTIGNHEFDYSVDNIISLEDKANFPFLSCTFYDLRTNELVFEPYTFVEADGLKIAIIGITTPSTITSSRPTYFTDENNNFIYGFTNDSVELWDKIQDTVDEVNKKGADIVIAASHLGSDEGYIYSSIDMIQNTSGIDVVLDGHSHSIIEGNTIKNKDGEDVLLTSTGEKLNNIGYLEIAQDGSISSNLVDTYEEKDEAVTLKIEEIKAEFKEEMSKVITTINVPLLINDPKTTLRMVRNQETNMGDIVADAYRYAGDSDIAMVNAGGVRSDILPGDVTKEMAFNVNPFGNMLCKVSIKGKEVLKILEIGAASLPEENGGFMQVSGITYTVDTSVASSIKKDEKGMVVSIDGEYRVKDVLINGEPLELEKEYTLTSNNYILKNMGEGVVLEDTQLLMDDFMVDADAFIAYIQAADVDQLYANPFGDGRILIIK
ncbi:MAG: bifunctional metallophosphatase/5'-nucleotidase [Erysipelotrichaceae bacterium]